MAGEGRVERSLQLREGKNVLPATANRSVGTFVQRTSFTRVKIAAHVLTRVKIIESAALIATGFRGALRMYFN
jgi:hypothetical protein